MTNVMHATVTTHWVPMRDPTVEMLKKIVALDEGIIPNSITWEPTPGGPTAWQTTDPLDFIRQVLASMPPEESRKARRKFRKMWRKVMKRDRKSQERKSLRNRIDSLCSPGRPSKAQIRRRIFTVDSVLEKKAKEILTTEKKNA